MVHCTYCSAFILEFVMNDVVELILNTYRSMCPLDAERAADSRQKISRYIESLASAGQRDAEQLTIYGLAYLTELRRRLMHQRQLCDAIDEGLGIALDGRRGPIGIETDERARAVWPSAIHEAGSVAIKVMNSD